MRLDEIAEEAEALLVRLRPSLALHLPDIWDLDRFRFHLHFDDFQLLLLETFSIILLATLILVLISWKLYGDRISERFMKPATSKAIQELKESVSRLKLPKEHTPRI